MPNHKKVAFSGKNLAGDIVLPTGTTADQSKILAVYKSGAVSGNVPAGTGKACIEEDALVGHYFKNITVGGDRMNQIENIDLSGQDFIALVLI